jgi:hypothetical protein
VDRDQWRYDVDCRPRWTRFHKLESYLTSFPSFVKLPVIPMGDAHAYRY